MGVLFANRYKTTLAADALAADGTLSLASAAGLPAIGGTDYAYLTLTSPDQATIEVVKALAIAGSVVTVARAQEGTAAVDWPDGTAIELRLTTQALNDALNARLPIKPGAGAWAGYTVGLVDSGLNITSPASLSAITMDVAYDVGGIYGENDGASQWWVYGYPINANSRFAIDGSHAFEFSQTPYVGNVAVSLSNHNHDATYLKLGGGTVTGALTVTGNSGSGTIQAAPSGAWSAERVLMQWTDLDRTMKVLGRAVQDAASQFTFQTANTFGFRVDATDILTIQDGGVNVTGSLQQGGVNVSLSTHNHDTAYLKLTGGTVTGTLTAAKLISDGDIVARGGSNEGGQIALGYGSGVATSVVGGGNLTWMLDVNSADAFRIFRQNGSGQALVAVQIAEANGDVTLGGTTIWLSSTKALFQHNGTHGFLRTQAGFGNLYIGAGGASIIAVTTAGASVTGTLSASGNITYSSDARLKADIRPLTEANAIFAGLHARRYIKDGFEQIGFIAQEVEQALPEAVHENDDGFKSLEIAPIVAVLVEKVRELEARLAFVEGRV